jgi:hypothetical protein
MAAACLLLISRRGEADVIALAAWLKDVGPWRCVSCPDEFEWMRKTDVDKTKAKLLRDGYEYDVAVGKVREISLR